MRRLALLCSAFSLLACAKTDKAAADSAAAAAAAAVTPAPPPAPAPIALADVAGKWTVRVMAEANDSTLLTYELTATADTAGWSIKFPDRAKPVPLRVKTDADSILTSAGPYPSALRKGVKVTTDGSLRLRDGKLVGSSTAHYTVKTADSVTVVRMEGTRKP